MISDNRVWQKVITDKHTWENTLDMAGVAMQENEYRLACCVWLRERQKLWVKAKKKVLNDGSQLAKSRYVIKDQRAAPQLKLIYSEVET